MLRSRQTARISLYALRPDVKPVTFDDVARVLPLQPPGHMALNPILERGRYGRFTGALAA